MRLNHRRRSVSEQGKCPPSVGCSPAACQGPGGFLSHWEMGNWYDEALLIYQPTVLVKNSKSNFLLNANHRSIH